MVWVGNRCGGGGRRGSGGGASPVAAVKVVPMVLVRTRSWGLELVWFQISYCEKQGFREIHMVHYDRVRGFVPVLLGLLMVTPLSLLHAQAPSAASNSAGAAGGRRIIVEGQPPVVIHATVGAAVSAREARGHSGGGSTNLYYHGGTGGIG